MRELIEAIREEVWQVSPTSIGSWGRGISPVLRGVYLAAVDYEFFPSAVSLGTVAAGMRSSRSRASLGCCRLSHCR